MSLVLTSKVRFDILAPLFMKKYLALAALPLFVISCSSTPRPLKYSDIPERPSQDLSERGTDLTNRGLGYPVRGVGQGAETSIDIVEDSADYTTGVGTRFARDGSNIVFKSANRGTNVVRKEGTRLAEVVYDVNDQGTQFIHDETIANPAWVMNGYERTMHSGGTVVCGVMTTYSNIWDSTTRGIFGGLLRCTVRDTKPYMVGSLNDTITDNTMPGKGWRKRLPDLSGYAVTEAPASGKAVYTSSK
jgi:hypothetical protein